ncbi:Synaptonemal complex 1 containing protein [Cricetulus griseus]|uniref:Synaptonemal complex 1 containing protein n=1 Tax=Cricetulus griseus TaxID=10029 RepID=A0A061IKT8_CRIGR|nr:Synaptonemal complex 1 containing protein [Cricetulus griseus]
MTKFKNNKEVELEELKKILCDIGYGLVKYKFATLGNYPSIPNLFSDVIMNGCLILSKAFSVSVGIIM